MASQNSTTKLSVIHGDTVAMININFNQSNSCFAKCQNRECTARLQNKKKIHKCRSIQQCENLCGLIQTLFANFEVVSELFPDYFVTNDGNSEANEDVCYGDSFAPELDANNINMEDQLVNTVSQEDTQKFDVNTGCWMFSARSNHKPKDMTNLDLTRYIFCCTL